MSNDLVSELLAQVDWLVAGESALAVVAAIAGCWLIAEVVGAFGRRST